MLTDQQIAELRSHFPILRDKTYLYSCSQGAWSDAVERGLAEFTTSWRSSLDPWRHWVEAWDSLRVCFARFIHAEPDEVAIVTSASAGINPIANALRFDQRNRVVMGEYEFPTMGHIWLAQKPRGAEIRFLDGVGNSIPVECYERTIDERTSIVPVTQISFVNGFRADLAAITRIAHARGALVFLDGYQDCGTRPIDVKALDVDFFVTGTLKYLLGPPGLAFLYVRRELIESLAPTLTSWMAQRDIFAFDTKRLDPAPSARRFECGTPAIPNICMARAALEFLAQVGMENVASQIARLTSDFLEGVRRLRIESKTPADSVGPLVVLRSTNATEMVARLASQAIAVSARKDGVRFSFHFYNTVEDVSVALAALQQNLELMVRA
ncbi:MAG TPA: aminotransferase class V-fold PLP-dependent enzyme [Bryobacteraceae bacterium]|nr:aminotransferase class V-fold PLP-dependent enzyme [Bryobacteraceae bacterium]